MISVGCNNPKSHPIQKQYNKFRELECNDYIHAETQAIINANCDLNGMSIFISREDMNGNSAICKPCKACMQLIKDVGIKRIVYTTYDTIEELEI